ncbi:MAG: methyltransferase [Thermoplasmata archaeon]|nr:methyltransferase [Thermoplasmata archaeon]
MASNEGSAPDHYFTERPRSPSSRRQLRFLFQGSVLVFEVDRGVFGSSGLDPGTALLIESLAVRPTDRVLDLGCGWGPVGIAAAKAAPLGRTTLTDVNRRAIGLARRNVLRNGVTNAEVLPGSLFAPVPDQKFDVIATNPPFHAGRELVLRMLAEAPDHLSDDGRLLVVGKGSQGILFYQRWLAEHWAKSVEVLARGSGYRVVEARRRPVSVQA